ncbi:hypothetical protein BC834DRAFT_874953 [Gloeopeniophorella convolvens]|nr:hypothetical protein BC834DRAFT_874953 [Gloeopeniophorella convolvens]
MPSSDTSLFKYARAASTVRVEQIPRGGGREIVDLFKTLIGPIRSVDFCGNGTSVEITFSNPDSATKSLCMSGYTVSGHSIVVSALSSPKPRAMVQAKSSQDSRRNLYVLGLPFDLSKAELSSVFSRFGAVNHCVILATVDNASRRRGFVVMSTHAEAKLAMENLSQTTLRGSIVDVSWAVVQRSQGFLDGGDRVVTLDNQVDTASASANLGGTIAFQTPGATGDRVKLTSPLPGAHSCHTSLLVHNLPSVLFSQESDLEPLFCPFGDIKEIRKQNCSFSATCSRTDTFSVVVTYSAVAGARDARDALQGQYYGDSPLAVELVPSFDQYHNATPTSNWDLNQDHISRSSLNPRASPFVFDSALALSAPPTCAVSDTYGDYFSKPTSSGLATPLDHFSLFQPTLQGPRSLPTSGLPSRSSSAASCWSAGMITQNSRRQARYPLSR